MLRVLLIQVSLQSLFATMRTRLKPRVCCHVTSRRVCSAFASFIHSQQLISTTTTAVRLKTGCRTHAVQWPTAFSYYHSSSLWINMLKTENSCNSTQNESTCIVANCHWIICLSSHRIQLDTVWQKIIDYINKFTQNTHTHTHTLSVFQGKKSKLWEILVSVFVAKKFLWAYV